MRFQKSKVSLLGGSPVRARAGAEVKKRCKIQNFKYKIQSSKCKIQNAKYKIQNAKALLLGNSPIRTKAGAKVEENRNCKNSKYKMECSLQLLFVQNANSKLEMQNAKKIKFHCLTVLK